MHAGKYPDLWRGGSSQSADRVLPGCWPGGMAAGSLGAAGCPNVRISGSQELKLENVNECKVLGLCGAITYLAKRVGQSHCHLASI